MRVPHSLGFTSETDTGASVMRLARPRAWDLYRETDGLVLYLPMREMKRRDVCKSLLVYLFQAVIFRRFGRQAFKWCRAMYELHCYNCQGVFTKIITRCYLREMRRC